MVKKVLNIGSSLISEFFLNAGVHAVKFRELGWENSSYFPVVWKTKRW